jgi:antitoxin MazE
MRKRLSQIGNSLGFVVEKPILELLHIDRDTEVEMVTDGQRLLISPVRPDKQKRVAESIRRVMTRHSEVMRKLADK